MWYKHLLLIADEQSERRSVRIKDPYQANMFSENPYFAKSDILGSLVVVLQGKLENRGLSLIKPISRCVQKHEIHELILSDETEIGPGSTVNNISYFGFAEITQGGVLTAGDKVYCAGKLIGTIAGFDETHMPNHINIVIRADRCITGVEHGACLGGEMLFQHVKNS